MDSKINITLITSDSTHISKHLIRNCGKMPTKTYDSDINRLVIVKTFLLRPHVV